MSVLKFLHDRAGDTSALTFELAADGAHGAVGPLGISPRTGFARGIIDAQGWAKAQGGSDYIINEAELVGANYRLTVLRGTTAISSISFVPAAINGIVDVNSLIREGISEVATPQQLLALNEAIATAQIQQSQVTIAITETQAATEEMRSVAKTYNLGRAPAVGDPAGTYRVVDSTGAYDVAWDGSAETARTPALLTQVEAPNVILDWGPVIRAERYGVYGYKDDNSAGLQDAVEHARSNKNIPDQQYGARTLQLNSDVIRIASKLGVYGSLKIQSTAPHGTILYQTNPDARIMDINSDVIDVLEGAPQNVEMFELDGVILKSDGYGVRLGSATLRLVKFVNGGCRNIEKGHWLDSGLANYFVEVAFWHVQDSGGVKVRPYSDLFTFYKYAVSKGKGYDLDLETTTFSIQSCNFEANPGNRGSNPNLANIVIRPSAIASGYGTIAFTRFGPEGSGLNADDGITAPHDILLSNEGMPTGQIQGVHLIGNKHFSKPGLLRKVSPVHIASGIIDLTIRDPKVNGLSAVDAHHGYSSPYIVTYDPASGGVAYSAADNYIDRLSHVDPALRGVFIGSANTNDGLTMRAVAVAPLKAWSVCYIVGWSERGLPKIQAAGTETAARQAEYVLGYAAGGEDIVQVYRKGAIVQTALDTSGKAFNDPVYINAAPPYDFDLGLIPPGGAFNRVIGRVMSIGPNAHVLLTFEPI